MKQKNGVTMINLVITIVVIIILVAIALSTGMLSISETAQVKDELELRNLKDAVANRMISNEKNAEKYPLVGNKIDDLIELLKYADNISYEDIESITNDLTPEKLDYYRIVDSNAAAMLGVESVAKTHYYIIDYYTGNVYGYIDASEITN